MDYLDPIDPTHPEFGDLYDELPIWSAPFGQLLFDNIPIRNGLTIVDIGAGTGFTTVELAQRCGAQSTIIAVDPWSSGMARLRRKIEFWGLENVELREQNAAELDILEASVDLVVSNLGINNFRNADAVLGRCFEVLKPGGRLALTTNLVGHMREFYDVFRATLIALDKTDLIDALEAHIAHRASMASLRRLLATAGFEPISVARDSFNMKFADGSALLRHTFIRLGFLPAWKAIIPEEAVEQTFSALERNLNTIAAERNGLTLTVPMACVVARKPMNRNSP